LVLQELSLQLLTVHPQLVLRIGQLVEEFLHGDLLRVVLADQLGILSNQLLVLVSLVGIELIESQLHLLVDVLEFILHAIRLLLNLLPL
jgi:hypothetical protein